MKNLPHKRTILRFLRHFKMTSHL